MRGKRQKWLAALAVSAAFVAPGTLGATDLDHGTAGPRYCGRPVYPRATYWIPVLRRLQYCFNPPPIGEVYYSDRYSEIPPSYRIQKFPCRYAEPAALDENVAARREQPPPEANHEATP